MKLSQFKFKLLKKKKIYKNEYDSESAISVNCNQNVWLIYFSIVLPLKI